MALDYILSVNFSFIDERTLPPETTELDVSSNSLTKVPNINALVKLERINLSDNRIVSILDSDFSLLPELEVVDLGRNTDLTYIRMRFEVSPKSFLLWKFIGLHLSTSQKRVLVFLFTKSEDYKLD